MGNHDVGKAMGLAATLAIKMRSGQRALDLLDEICGPYKNTDAEFESEDPKNPGHTHPAYVHYTDPEGPIGKLIIEAFVPLEFRDHWANSDRDDDFYDRWFDGPYGDFRKRFGFW